VKELYLIPSLASGVPINVFVVANKDGIFHTWGTSIALEVTIHKILLPHSALVFHMKLPSIGHRIELVLF